MVGGVHSALALHETKYIYTIILYAPESLTLQQVKCIHLNNWVSEPVEKICRMYARRMTICLAKMRNSAGKTLFSFFVQSRNYISVAECEYCPTRNPESIKFHRRCNRGKRNLFWARVEEISILVELTFGYLENNHTLR